jgi:hypothetical protein
MWQWIQLKWLLCLCAALALDPKEVAIGVSTCKLMHENRVASLLSSWGGRALQGGMQLQIFSDKGENLDGTQIHGCEGCDSSTKGIPCKTVCLFRGLWEAYPDAKWFVRVMDDTLVVPENLMRYLSTLDADKPHVVGDFFWEARQSNHHRPAHCTYPLPTHEIPGRPGSFGFAEECLAYPGGGAGWGLSRAAMRQAMPQLGVYSAIIQQHREIGEGIADDLYFGYFMVAIGLAPSLEQSSCFSQSPLNSSGSSNGITSYTMPGCTEEMLAFNPACLQHENGGLGEWVLSAVFVSGFAVQYW